MNKISKFIIGTILFIIFIYASLILTYFSTFYSPTPEYLVYKIAEKYNMETNLILVESIDDEIIEITDKKIVYEILNMFNTIPSVKHNSDRFLFFFTYGRASWNSYQEGLDLHQKKKTLIFNDLCKITIYGSGLIYDYFRVEYNGKMNKYETVQKGFYDDIMKLVNDKNSNLQ